MSNRSPARPSSEPFESESANENRKLAAECPSCGAIYAAERLSDGSIRPIGRKNGCQCGACEFEAIDDSGSR